MFVSSNWALCEKRVAPNTKNYILYGFTRAERPFADNATGRLNLMCL